MIRDFFSNEPRLARRLGAEALYSIHAFRHDAVGRIVGKVGRLQEEKPIAPVTGRVCAGWFLRVSGAQSSVLEARSTVPFTVSDETGEAIVRADDSSLLLAFDVEETVGIGGRPPPRLLDFLHERRKQGNRIPIDWRLSWQEGIIAEGQRVAIVGRGRREVDPEAGEGDYRKPATRLVMMRSAEDEEFFVSTFEASLGGK